MKPITCFLSLLLVLPFAGLNGETNQIAFEIGGRLDVRQGRDRRYYNFHIYNDPHQWHVKVFKNGKTNELGHEELACRNGSRIQYRVMYMNREPFTKALAKPDSTFINGGVVSNTLPHSYITFWEVYWLAFRANGGKEKLPEQLSSLFVYPSLDRPLKTEYVFDNPTTKTLREVKIFNPGVVYGSSGKQYPLAEPFTSGYVVGLFSISARTNILGEDIPTTFKFQVFSPKTTHLNESGGMEVAGSELEVLTSCEGKVEHIAAIPVRSSIKPDVPAPLNVVDFRYSRMTKIEGNSYHSEKGFLDLLSPEFQENVRSELERKE